MIEPGTVFVMIVRMIAALPGRDQSRGSTDQSSGRMPWLRHSARTAWDHSPPGALHHGLVHARWDAVVAGPGPGILGTASALGHGGLAALDTAHTALALGARALISPRMSSGDPRPRHRGLSHHTRTVLDLLLRPVTVGAPPGQRRDDRHEWREAEPDLDAYRASGLPARTMGRSVEEDPLFFAAGLAAGRVLADIVRAR